MGRYLRYIAWVLLCSLLLLTGCSSNGPVSATATQGDFEVTLVSVPRVYDSGELDPEAPLHFEVRIDYLGEMPLMTLTYGARLGSVDLYTAEGEYLLDRYLAQPGHLEIMTPSVLLTSGLRPDEIFTKVDTCSLEYELLGPLEPGKYVAKTHVEFTAEARVQEPQDVELDLEVPFEIK